MFCQALPRHPAVRPQAGLAADLRGVACQTGTPRRRFAGRTEGSGVIADVAVRRDRVVRAFDVLEWLSSHIEGLRLTEINWSLQLSLSITHALVSTIMDAGLFVGSAAAIESVRALRMSIRLVDSVTVRDATRRHLPARQAHRA